MVSPVTILPTSRAIRALMLERGTASSFLPRCMTMGEFLQRVLIAEGFKRIDDDTRTLLLYEAADFVRFGALQIERNFFTFTHNASYLFRFFEELAGERIAIEALDAADTYGDYEEHIAILGELHRRYRQLCDERRLLDPIFAPELTRLNESYLHLLGAIEIVVEGYLTNFELQTLQRCAALIPTYLRFSASPYNGKMRAKFETLGITTVAGYGYRIDLAALKVCETWEMRDESRVVCEALGEPLLQVAFIKQKVYEFIRKGIAPERIAVVLPNEGFAEHLKRFDDERNFNFAMGTSLAASAFVRRFEAAIACIENATVENRSRIERIGKPLYERIRGVYSGDLRAGEFLELIRSAAEEESDPQVAAIVDEECFRFEKILPRLEGGTLKSALHLFINRLKKRTLDDVRGGKITVMGVLETRAVRYEGVIVVDFNEGIVPRKSEKDLFLNSATRIRAGLPGARDREALQKHYYHALFSGAREVAIAYVESVDAVPSRFLNQLGIRSSRSHSDASWAGVLFDPADRERVGEVTVACDYDFTARPLSATGLKHFLECKRRFYHRYVEGLKEHEIPEDLPDEKRIGTVLHEALRAVYSARPRFNTAEELRRSLHDALKTSSGETVLDDYLHKLWTRRLEPFIEREIERFKEAEVQGCEVALETSCEGITIAGRLDRIDRTPEGMEVLDYKSGSFPVYSLKSLEKATDFQLEFYYLLASTLGKVDNCGYYDLQSGEIVYETLLEPKLALLQEHLAQLRQMQTVVFDKTDTLSACRYCEFTHLCGREL